MTGSAARQTNDGLLSSNDPPSVEHLNEGSDHPLLLICEHAGQLVPERLGDLGVPRAEFDRHIGWDIGARAVTERLAAAFGAPAILQRYSRLVIDCNRPPVAPDSMPEVSDGTPVPGNCNLTAEHRAQRVAEIFDPFQAAVAAGVSHPARRAVISVHSFNPVLAGVVRPWEIAFLYRGDANTPTTLRDALMEQDGALNIGMNEPYQIDDASDWFVPRQGEASGLPHSLIEIRNDLISDTAGQARWADLLHIAITRLLEGRPT